MPEKSKIETAIDYIAKHGSARTPELADLLRVPEKNVQPNLQKPIETGYLVSCSVEVNTPDGMRKMKEYRLSALVSESKQTWAGFLAQARNRKPSEGLSETQPDQVILPAPRVTPKKATKPVAELVPAESTALIDYDVPGTIGESTPASAQPEPKPAVQGDKHLFMIGSDRCLRIVCSGIEITLSADETKDLGDFICDASRVWNLNEQGDSRVIYR